MRRILYRHICSNWIKQFLSVLVVMGIYFAWEALAYYGNSRYMEVFFWEEYWNTISFGGGGYAGVLMIVMVNEWVSHVLPDAVFVMPLSKKEREIITKKAFFATWIGRCLIIGLVAFLPPYFQKELDPMHILWLLLMLLTLVYINQYYEYFKIMDSMLTGAVLFVTILLTSIILGVEYDWCESVIEMLILFGIVLVFIGINIHIHRKYFELMIAYYTDYEASRQLREKKTLKK